MNARTIPDRERIELELLLETLYRAYGCDFRRYAPASIERRARQFLSGRPERSLAELIPIVLAKPDIAAALVQSFSVTVTEMFRDPWVYAAIREQAVPLLRTYPSVRVWHAGCATGEEAYATAIVLHEEGLLERSVLYATDLNDESLARGRAGIYPAKELQDATRRYQEAGGRHSFSDYYTSNYGSAVMEPGLRRHITFSNHNLTTDGPFGEMHLIFCRNVLIYFSQPLREHALRLIDDSLIRGGYLCLGTKESLHASDLERAYQVIDQRASLFRKVSE